MTMEELKQEFDIKEIPDGLVITRWKGKDSECVIPDDLNIVGIQKFAFSSRSNLTKITIPDSVTDIGWYAFRGCHSLLAFQVDEKNPIYTSADGVLFNKDKTELLFFPGGKKGKYIVPDGVVAIAERAFEKCSMTEVMIPDSVKNIGENVFSHCENLTAVHLPNKLKELNDDTFSWCPQLKTVKLPDSLRKIKSSAFLHCESLSQIAFPEKLKTIGLNAFYGCESLKKVVLPAGVKISKESFDKHIVVVIPEVDTPTAQDIIEKKAFSGSDITSLEVEEGIKKIKEQAYKDCKLLKTVSLPRSLTDLGASVFDGCQVLSSVTYHGDSLIKIGKNTFRGTLFEKEYIKNIKIVDSPCALSEETMICLGSTLLFCRVNAEEVIIPAGIEGIAPFAFQKCRQLTRISIPQTVKWIAKEAFVPEREKSPSPSLEIFAVAGSVAEKHTQKELTFFVPISAEKAEDSQVFEEYKLVKDTEYKKQLFKHIFEKAISDATKETYYKIKLDYTNAISNDGGDILIEEKEAVRLLADPEFTSLFLEYEQKVLQSMSRFSIKNNRIIPLQMEAELLIKLLSAFKAFAESPVSADMILYKNKWEYRGDYGSSSQLCVRLDERDNRVRVYLERQTPWDM